MTPPSWPAHPPSVKVAIMSSAIRRAGVPCSLLIGSALLVACNNESPPSAKSDPAERQLSDQTAEREQMTRDGDAMIACGKKMYEQGVAAHDDGMIQDGRLMM